MQKLRLMHHTPKVTPLNKPVYIGLFFLAFHYYLIVYINSNFLAQFMSEAAVGFIYIAGSVASLGSLMWGPKLLKKIGCRRLAVYASVAEVLSLGSLAIASDFETASAAFILQHITNPIILFCLDVFLESMTRNSQSGRVRGIYLTILNTPAVMGALISGLILINAEYYKVFLSSAFFMLPLIYILLVKLKDFKDPPYKPFSIEKAFDQMEHSRSIKDVFIDTTLLHSFYALATIYLPIYLYQVVGLTLGQIGLIFAIALIPFIILQMPIGRLADKKYGEKEFLVGGFILMSFATMSISYITTNSIWIWTLILILTRIGAATVEIATESYFFKQVSKTDTHIIGLFRMSHGIAFVVMPLLGLAALSWFSIQWFFVLFGVIIMILGLRYAFDLEDSR